MRTKAFIIAAAILTASAGPSSAVGLFGGAGKNLFDGAPHRAPFGFVELCVRQKSVCRPVRANGVETLAGGAVAADPRRLAELAEVDRAVDRSIRPRNDPRVNGFADRWTIGAREGDCEEYALEKRRRLMALGWPSSALVIAIGRIRGDVQHAVLLARVGEDVYVLDNLERRVVPFRSARIDWLAAQSPDDPKRWISL